MKASNAALKTLLSGAGLFILLTVSALPVQAGHYLRFDEDVRGKVVDADTRQPLEGVVVMALWVTEHTRITIEPEERYYDYYEVLTDANGEFTIPGKGQNILRNMPPPKIQIYKAGYPIRDIRYRITFLNDDTPWDVKVTKVDGNRFVLYRKLSESNRKKYVKHYSQTPYSKMARSVSPEKYSLYTSELAKDYQALGLHQRQPGAPVLIIKRALYPAASQAVSPQKTKP